jgi:tetratricopeptide (TPR) repeat protein
MIVLKKSCIFASEMIKRGLLIWLLCWIVGSGICFAHEIDPYALRQEALHDFDQGRAADAQKKLIQSQDLFVEAQNWDMVSMCLYERAIDYMNVGDLENMATQKKELQYLYERKNSAIVAYNYHSVASGYYSYVDSIELAIQHGWGAIHALEQIDDPYAYNIVPVWSYYNIAFFYDMYFDPPQVDSVRYYLARSREVLKDSRTWKESIEGLISVVDLEAWQEYYEKDYFQAEQMMLEVIAMIDTVAKVSPNTVITERGEAYKFLSMIYEEQGKWQKALDYKQKLIENNDLRYDVDKRRVLQDIQTKYEVEKQTLQMEKLAAENKSNRWIMVALWLLLVAMVLCYWLLEMRRKNIEAKFYEAALEADNMRQTINALESKTDVDPLVILVDELVEQLLNGRKREYVESAVTHLRNLDLNHIQSLLSHAKKLTTMDKRYILCFAAGMTVENIADLMSLEPASVYTVRYRLRKKFSSEYPFPY